MTAEEYIALKAKVKAEMLRRNAYGSLAEFGGSDYDFETVPTSGSRIIAEQGQKVIDLALKIEDVGGLGVVYQYDYLPHIKGSKKGTGSADLPADGVHNETNISIIGTSIQSVKFPLRIDNHISLFCDGVLLETLAYTVPTYFNSEDSHITQHYDIHYNWDTQTIDPNVVTGTVDIELSIVDSTYIHVDCYSDYGHNCFVYQLMDIYKPGGREMENLNDRLDTWAQESMTGEVSSCRGACTGLCVSSCYGGCKSQCSGCSGCGGCSGSCGNSCKGSCGGCSGCWGCSSCGGACSANCATVCSTDCAGCTGMCYAHCGGGCSSNCHATCAVACKQSCGSSNCKGLCKGGCKTHCHGCSGGCSEGCGGWACRANCSSCNGCAGCNSCSGCSGGCQNSCTGCKGCSGCSTGCQGCSGCTGCSSGCESSCLDQCTTTCTTTCSNQCYGNCSNSSTYTLRNAVVITDPDTHDVPEP